jgi:hypothetical protein
MVVYRLVVEAKAAGSAAVAAALAGWQEAARMKGWRLLPGSNTFEGSEGVPQAMEFLFDSLQAAKERGEVQEGYDIKLLVDDGAAPAAAAGPTGPAPAATPAAKSKKSRWAGLFI